MSQYCEYAYRAGKSQTLEKLRIWCNEQFEKTIRARNELNSTHCDWWKLQGEIDMNHKLLEKLGNIIGDKE